MNTRYSPRLEQSGNTPISTEFERLFETVGNHVADIAEFLEVPPIEVTAVVADDFSGEVERTAAMSEDTEEYGGGKYHVERLGAVAVAQTTRLARDGSRCRIVFDRSRLFLEEDPLASLKSALFIAHEMAHPLFFRMHSTSGTVATLDRPFHPVEFARAITRNAADEMRCDIVADVVLRQMATLSTPDSPARPATIADTALGDGLRVSVGEVLDETIYPGWPDFVDQYRTHQLTVDRLWRTMINQTAEVFNLLAYAQVPARAADRPGPLEAEFAEHPGSRLYLGPTWIRILDAAGDRLVVPLSEFRDCEDALLSAGEGAIVDMWARAGLTFGPPQGRDCFYVHVADPVR